MPSEELAFQQRVMGYDLDNAHRRLAGSGLYVILFARD